VGTSDILLDDARRLAARMKSQDVEVDLGVCPEMIHVWHLYAAVLPEGKEAIGQVGAFLKAHLQG
jgi:acetyl esterase/lipase